MNVTRILGSVVAVVLASSLGTLVACNGTSDKQETVPTSQAVSAASVQIAILDSTGAKIGTASGTLIAPQLVLTAAHNISGQAKWSVTSADGKQVATSSRAMSYDWMNYDSSKAHPRLHDVGVIHLDAPIKLDAYPKLVSDKATDNVSATRIRGINGAFVKSAVTLNKVQSSPNNWLGNAIAGESLDTGGAVYDDRGILGVMSGQGTSTGKLYVARVDGLNSWLEAKVACAGGASETRTYVAPVVDKSVADCDAGGASSGTISTTSSSGSTSTSTPSGSSGTGGSCSDNNDGHCSGAGCGTGGTNGTSGDDDDSTGSTAGSSGSSGSSGNGSSGSSGGPSGTNANAGSSGNNGGSAAGSSGTSGSSGNGSGAASSGSSGSNPNTNGTTGNSGASAGSLGSSGNGSSGTVGGAGSNPNGGNNGEVCQGSSDNADICPPEPTGCTGPTCGGGTPDDAIDYGNCACASGNGGDMIVK